MLGRAAGKYEAEKASEAPQPNALSKKPTLAKQLFPSSSPHDGNIVDQFKKARPPSSSFNKPFGPASFVKPSRPREPLQPQSANISPPVPRSGYGGSGKSFASLYNKSNSFTEQPEVIDLIDDEPSQASTKTLQGSVYIAEDDFSDDDNLDLDFECPSALPTLPPPPKPATVKREEPPLPSSTNLSWSQSSPSHFARPQARTKSESSTSQKSVKRQSPEEDLPTPLPAAKKRALPKHYKQPEYPELDQGGDQPFGQPYAAATPVPKKTKDPLPWNTTASAVKEQKKQLKIQSKKPAATADASVEDIKETVKAHTSATAQISAISLSNEQTHVKNLVCEMKKSVFFTGPAGTGKSVLMRAIIQDLKKKWARDPERLAVTASTGLAACNIGGMTLHSFSGIGLGKEDVQTLVKKIRRNPKAKNRWLRAKTLIIDEISMVDGDLFDKLSQIGRIIRNNGRPWGGIQLVITGDFFQLPPVPDGDKKREVKFAFEAATWNTSIDHTIGLTEVFRQKDPVFAQMLNEMRLGQISQDTVKAFQGLSRPLRFDDDLEVTELFPTRNEVENSNEKRLKALPGKSYRYDAHDTGDPAIREKLLQNMMAPKTLELKKGAQVMLIKNMDETLVNGSLGKVIGFMTESHFNITGGGFDAFGADDEGMDTGMDPKVKKRLAMFSRELDSSAGPDRKEYPLVQFHAVDGTPRILLCVSEPWKVELPTGEVQASREQLPLILAWALSIHKAQGQTLERVKVDLGKVFEKGQAYVALSRATTQAGLQVLRFEKHKVMAHPRVVQFYQKLYSAESAIGKKKPAQTSIANFAFQGASKPVAKKGYEVVDLDDDEEAMAAYG
ncbi:putative dna repair and recombination protein pif1 protein [Phaeoacremonium minimum UCRPA7]|uniref:ATP-dependent DNA helicase PIF1 n=1 Tax=Phaeoacremonium minimum (strain UCR-PA7) TaxID=1286976 RepID=R8BS17_PHAM7|nr:putative dna repair and recombination protein pif1 protein [Phaeoacremonium minimum UCRPA7]EOO02136.1 putative dna repair and recombination protein pif1 protein [Phaeoacremonium minimum UCRPA7]